jgi:hypothetical protein
MRAFYHLRATLRNLFELLWNKPFPAATKRPAFAAALASQDLALRLGRSAIVVIVTAVVVVIEIKQINRSLIAGLFSERYGLSQSDFGFGKLSRLRELIAGRSQLRSMNFNIDTWSDNVRGSAV